MTRKPNRIRTSLQGWLGATPSSSEDLKAMRAAVWHKQEIVVVPLQEIRDAATRNLLRAIAEKLYGHRRAEA
ncbi:hypothetical protein [uncultured Desulfovibrio sp.]|uniref:hypothetical protein n=1 Tax=uncultured Desulfovibrio sp. TaxID=167968 RepID=UPI00205CB0E2|nr:hypothetical protein [uncultured Desulfovibrio sp.]DAV75471.1 MAG TPA: hypothetical protein [Caudoviricetes sp.]